MIATEEELRLEKFLRERESGKLIWKDKEGHIIPLKDLTSEHLDNILRAKEVHTETSTAIKPSSFNFY